MKKKLGRPKGSKNKGPSNPRPGPGPGGYMTGKVFNKARIAAELRGEML
jgi:hypothetical protein